MNEILNEMENFNIKAPINLYVQQNIHARILRSTCAKVEVCSTEKWLVNGNNMDEI